MWEAVRNEGEVMHNPGRDGGAEEAERSASTMAGIQLPAGTDWPEMPPGGCPRRPLQTHSPAGPDLGAAWQGKLFHFSKTA